MILQVLNPENYSLNGFAMPMLVVGVAIAAPGLFVLVREHGSLTGILFLLMCLSVSLYLVATGANYASRDDGLSLFRIRISQLGSVFIPTTVLLLTAARLGLFHRFRFTIAASIVLSTLLALGIFFTDLHVRGSARFFWGNFVQYGPLGFVYIGFFFCIMVLIFRLNWQEYRRSMTELHIRPEVKVLFTSGYPADLIQKEGVLEKGLNFLSKPASHQALLRMVREVLD